MNMNDLNITYEEQQKIIQNICKKNDNDNYHIIITGTNQLKSCMSRLLFSNYFSKLDELENSYVLPVELPNCETLTIRKTFLGIQDDYQLSSTYGLPKKVFHNVHICDQNYLDCDDLDYHDLSNVSLEHSNFKSFKFLKKWQPTCLTLMNTNFKSFDNINENVLVLSLGELCSRDSYITDFSKITLLKNLKTLMLYKSLGVDTQKKSMLVNIIEILNLHDSVEIKIHNEYSSDVGFDIIKKYFDKADRKQYMMDCLLELLDNDYMNAGG